jgi:hypothetical protein
VTASFAGSVPSASQSALQTASPYIVLTASSLDALALTYVGTFTVPGASGGADVLRVAMASGSATGLRVTQPCRDGSTTIATAGSATLGSATLDVVRFAATRRGPAARPHPGGYDGIDRPPDDLAVHEPAAVMLNVRDCRHG